MKSEKIYLTVSQDYVQDWGFWEGVRELLQNMGDCENYEYETYNCQGDRWVSMKTYDGIIPRETLLLGNSGKRDDVTKVGGKGEGYKMAFLVLTRMGYQIRIKNGFDKWVVSFEKHPQLNTECLCVEIIENFYNVEDTEDNTVDITVHGITQEDAQTLEENYLGEGFFNWIHSEDILVDHGGCQVFRFDTNISPEDRGDLCDADSPKKVFVNGLFVCDLPNDYVFSYNLTPDRITLDRDRQSVSTWDLQREVATLLEDAGAFELMVRMSEEKVPDLYEYYTPSRYKSVSSSCGSSDTQTVNEVLNKLATEAFVKRHGEKAMAVNQELCQAKRDIIKNRLKLGGYTPVEVPRTNFDMLDKSVTQVPDGIPVKNTTPKVMLERYFEANKKHMRSKARKEMEKLIEDLILVS
ncbi:hypothetical protein VPHK460_0117 [Vibrio phage K460]